MSRIHGDRRRRGAASGRGVSGTSATVPATKREEDGKATGTRQEARHANVVRNALYELRA